MKVILALFLATTIWPLSAMQQTSHQNWPMVGKATLTWGFWTVYHSTLKTPSGKYQNGQLPLSLSINYQIDIDKKDLLEETDKQWQHLNIEKSQRDNWIKQLEPIWPDVKENDNLTFVFNKNGGEFYFNENAIGQIEDPTLAQGFIDIWLSEQTKYPKLRARLIAN